MPPANNYNNGGYGCASRQGDGSALPEKLWCYLGRHNAPSSRFSKNQLAQYHNAKRRQGKVVDKNLKMMCRDHSGEPALQLKCMGPCHRLLAKTKFSHNQRHNKLRWCQQCIKWCAQQDHDTVPNAHPNGVVSPGEMAPPVFGSVYAPFGSFERDESFSDAGHHSIIDEDDTDEGDDTTDCQLSSVRRGPADSDDDSDDDDDIIGYGGYSSYNLRTHGTTSSAAPLSVADTRSIAPQIPSLAFDNDRTSHGSGSNLQSYNQTPSMSESMPAPIVSRLAGLGLTGGTSTTMASGTTSQKATTTRPEGKVPYLPPHLRDDDDDYIDPFSARTTPSVTTDDFGTGSRSVASSSRNAGRHWATPQQFNAYGPDGQLQRREADINSVQTRWPAKSTATASVPAGRGIRRRPDKGNWARPDMRKQFDYKETFVTSNDTIVDIYDSGSADEM